MSPLTATLRTRETSKVEDMVACAVVQIDVRRWLTELAIHARRQVAAVQLPGWMAFEFVAGGFEDADIRVAIAVVGAPDLAKGSAVADGGALSCGRCALYS